MSKHIASKSAPLGGAVTVKGRPISVSASGGSQFTVLYEDNPPTSHDIQSFKATANIPDSAEYIGSVGDGANAWFLYVL